MPIIKSSFKPAWWLRNAHLQTLWSTFFKERPDICLEKFRLELDDGDFIDLSSTKEINQKPIVVIVHGLEGTLESHYAKPLIKQLDDKGYGVLFIHFRGCSGEPNRLKRSYHSGDSAELQTVVEHIKSKYKRIPFAIIGFSLGGNVLLKWLGEQQANANTLTAIAISVPFRLADAADRLEKSFSRVLGNGDSEAPKAKEDVQIDYTGKNLLLVEDNKVNQMVAKALLKKLGLEITVANDGLEALDAYQKDSFDMVLMDINMPNMGGIEATQELHKMMGNMPAKTPIIALTANVMEGAEEEYRSYGMNGYLTKPIEMDKFKDELNKWL